MVTACARRGAVSDAGPPIPEMPAAGEPARRFAPGVVSTGDVFASTFTPDGRTVVFTKFSPPRMTLMMSSFVDGRWSAPTVLPFSGTYRDLDPAFSPDGRRLYFSSWRPRDAASNDTSNASDTWYVDRTGEGWGAPVRIGDPVNSTEVDMYPSTTRTGVLYFDSFRSQPRRRLVYRSAPRGDGTYDSARVLDVTINADSGASNAFVDPDERYLVFGAVRPGGLGGMDLYISWRDTTGTWSTPRNLGPTVNTSGTEFCPFVSRDGRYLFFTRISPPGVSPITRNIYVVRFDALVQTARASQ
jgi:hypothetical protein